MENLVGKKFNRWTVDSYAGNYTWNCICECKNKSVVSTYSLQHGTSKSCGCFKNELSRKRRLVDLTGKVFSDIKVLSLDRVENNKYYWECECLKCGKHIKVRSDSLTRGEKTSCGCDTKKHDFVDYTIVGKRFGKLVVDSLAYTENGYSYWNCDCDCGNSAIVIRNDLVNNHTKSCGCKHRLACIGSSAELDVVDYIKSMSDFNIIFKDRTILDGKEIDIYLPEYNLGIEYNGSAFHASENAVYENKDKHYHRDKFLLAKKKGIHLISVFDVDYKLNKNKILSYIKDCIFKTIKHEIPTESIVYTNNDYDDGEWLKEYGYVEDSQIEPESYKVRSFIVYRSGKTKYVK